VPDEGEKIELPSLKIQVLAATDTQVIRARLTKTHPAATENN